MTARAIKKIKQNANKDKPETLKKWGGGGGEDFTGDHLIFGRTKGGSLKTLEGFRGGTTQICSENEGIGGIAKVIKGDHFSEVTFKGGIGQISPCLAQNPPVPRR